MEDREIIELYWNRDELAIKATADKYGNYCAYIANNILNNSEDAEECVSDTYLNAWNTIPPLKPSVLSAYLGKITRHLSLNKYKRKNAYKRGSGSMPIILDEIGECISGGDTPEDVFERKELANAINTFLSKLPKERRAIFVRRYFFFDSIDSIAQRFSLPANNLPMILKRIREKLHSYLIKEGFEL